jgi:hypothetical protein
MLFGGRGRKRRAPPAGAARAEQAHASADDAARAVGQYLTDGAALFRVLHAIKDSRGRTTLLELEDCHSLQLLICDADAILRSPLEWVTPASFGSDDARRARSSEHPVHKVCVPEIAAPPFAGSRTG